MKGQQAAEGRKNALGVVAAIKAEATRATVQYVLVHRDNDAVEPHQPLNARLRSEVAAAGFDRVVAVTPAWAIEAWWYLWPQAVASVNVKWRPLGRRGDHGQIPNVKAALRRDLRTAGAADYRESDSVKIAAAVRKMGLLDTCVGHAPSFDAFRRAVKAIAESA